MPEIRFEICPSLGFVRMKCENEEWSQRQPTSDETHPSDSRCQESCDVLESCLELIKQEGDLVAGGNHENEAEIDVQKLEHQQKNSEHNGKIMPDKAQFVCKDW